MREPTKKKRKGLVLEVSQEGPHTTKGANGHHSKTKKKRREGGEKDLYVENGPTEAWELLVKSSVTQRKLASASEQPLEYQMQNGWEKKDKKGGKNFL